MRRSVLTAITFIKSAAWGFVSSCVTHGMANLVALHGTDLVGEGEVSSGKLLVNTAHVTTDSEGKCFGMSRECSVAVAFQAVDPSWPPNSGVRAQMRGGRCAVL